MRRFLLIIAIAFLVLSLGITVYIFIGVCFDLTSICAGHNAMLSQLKENFGDFYGGIVGSLLSTAATLFIVITFKEQKEQFRQSQQDAFRARFENTFFSLLSMLYDVRKKVNDDLALESGQTVTSISDFYQCFRSHYLNHLQTNKDYAKAIEILKKDDIVFTETEGATQCIGKIYSGFIDSKKLNIGYYYRYVFNLISYVTTEWGTSEADSHRYLNFIQAQMSDEELALIFYDVISRHGQSKNKEYKFKNLLDEHGFLENIDCNYLFDHSHHKIYGKTVFRFLNNTEKARINR